jgi:hypothetical protein
MHKFEILVEILLRESWRHFSEIVVGQVVSGLDLTGKESASKWRVTDHGDA